MARKPKANPAGCTQAVLAVEFKYGPMAMARRQDRIDGLLMKRLGESPTRRTMSAKERHRLTAMIDGELTFNFEWRLS